MDWRDCFDDLWIKSSDTQWENPKEINDELRTKLFSGSYPIERQEIGMHFYILKF